jgi:hypothetical protein
LCKIKKNAFNSKHPQLFEKLTLLTVNVSAFEKLTLQAVTVLLFDKVSNKIEEVSENVRNPNILAK